MFEEFLAKYIYLAVKSDAGIFFHKCALLNGLTDTHITILDAFNGKPYFYKISNIEKIELSKKDPEEVKKEGGWKNAD